MSNIDKIDYIECMSRMMDMTNEELKKYPEGSFISCGSPDEVVDYFRVESVRTGMCVVRRSFFSIAIETLRQPSMIVEPIAQKYYHEWRSMKGKSSKEIITFFEGGKSSQYGRPEWRMPAIEPFYRWHNPTRGESGIGRIEKAGGSYTIISTVDNIEIAEVLNNVKRSIERRNEENECRRQEQLKREKQARFITKNMIDDLLKSI